MKYLIVGDRSHKQWKVNPFMVPGRVFEGKEPAKPYGSMEYSEPILHIKGSGWYIYKSDCIPCKKNTLRFYGKI